MSLLSSKLEKTKIGFTKKIKMLFTNENKTKEEILENLEEILISSDVGIKTTEILLNEMNKRIIDKNLFDTEEAYEELKQLLVDNLKNDEIDKKSMDEKKVILVTGVNGVGKTTTIGKLANIYKSQGKKVIVGAADTFRAGAIAQLSEWCERAQVLMISNSEGSDPASVVFDTSSAAKKRDSDIVLIDTAGRLQNKTNLMNELSKIDRVISRELSEYSKEKYLVIDATTGQNAIYQAREFSKYVDINGLIITKMDGTSKGGSIFSIKEELKIPIEYIGVGEHINDLKKFDAQEFVNALFE